MGASPSKIEEDKALQLCRERKKFVRQALDGRCSLAATHFTYIESLRNVGTALRMFIEPEAPIESSLYASTSATPEPLALTEKSLSQFSFSPSLSQRVDATENFSSSASPHAFGQYQANHMKFRGAFSKKVEEQLPVPVMGSVTSSSTPQNNTPRSTERPEASPFEASPVPLETSPWDYFGFSHPIDNHFSTTHDGKGLNQGLDNADVIRRLRKEEGIPELEDEEDKLSSFGREESQDSEDEFDEPSSETLVQSFENVNRASDHVAASASPPIPSAASMVSETEFVNGDKNKSPDLSPLTATSSGIALPSNVKNVTRLKEDVAEHKVVPKDLFSSMKEIEYLFVKAAESGKDVPRMLEANKFHFRPIFPGTDRGSMPLMIMKACFSCGKDPVQIQEEPVQTTVKYLTWHRIALSRSSSSQNPLGANSLDEIEDLSSSLFNNCMISGSHASTLDRLFAWERKLYDEVKASQIVRAKYDAKCKLLRQLESKDESKNKIDKTRAVVKDLHSRIRVAIHRIDSISRKIEELRDDELQPQLDELIEGLRRMWEVMFECHKVQFDIISTTYSKGNRRTSIHSESHRRTVLLEDELGSLSSSFTKWVGAQKTYLQALNGWLFKCISLQEKSTKRKRKKEGPPLRNFGPPIYITCGVWLDMLDKLPAKGVTDSMKGLAAEINCFLPHQEKNQEKGRIPSDFTPWHDGSNGDMAGNLLGGEASGDQVNGFDCFQRSLARFLGQLSYYAESSSKMFTKLQEDIQNAKNSYNRQGSFS